MSDTDSIIDDEESFYGLHSDENKNQEIKTYVYMLMGVSPERAVRELVTHIIYLLEVNGDIMKIISDGTNWYVQCFSGASAA